MDGEVPHRVTVEVTPDRLDLAVDALWCTYPLAVSEEEVDGGVLLSAGYPGEHSARSAATTLVAWSPTVEAEPGHDWVDRWRIGASPQLAGRFHIRLPEHPVHTDAVDLEIEPGPTFGFGHPSTLLALELLDGLHVAGQRVADVGSGSGVLAVAAARLGATVHAVDVDPDAVKATADNATRNGVAVDVRLGSIQALPSDTYDLALVNVTAEVHRRLLPDLRSRLAPRARVLLSGLLVGQLDDLAAMTSSHREADRRQSEGWEAAVLVHA